MASAEFISSTDGKSITVDIVSLLFSVYGTILLSERQRALCMSGKKRTRRKWLGVLERRFILLNNRHYYKKGKVDVDGAMRKEVKIIMGTNRNIDVRNEE